MTITEFLLARIAEDEAEAKWVDAEGDNGSSPVQHPARVLAECAAKRAIVGHVRTLDAKVLDSNLWNIDEHDDIPRALAAVYSDHPDYNADWAL